MMTSIQMKDVIESAGFRSRSYRGRGMTKDCIGFCTNKSAISAIGTMLEVIAENDSIEEVLDFAKAIRKAGADSMGRGSIVYFPGLAWDPAWKEMDEDGDDENEEG